MAPAAANGIDKVNMESGIDKADVLGMRSAGACYKTNVSKETDIFYSFKKTGRSLQFLKSSSDTRAAAAKQTESAR